MNILKKQESQQISINQSSNIDFKDFVEIYRKGTAEQYSFLVNDTTLPSDNALCLRKKLLQEV